MERTPCGQSEQKATARYGAATDRWRGPKEEFLGPPRRSRRAQFVAAAFGVLMILSLVLPGFEDRSAMSLMFSGLAAMFFAELLDPSLRWFLIALRLGGPLIALTGFVLQLL